MGSASLDCQLFKKMCLFGVDFFHWLWKVTWKLFQDADEESSYQSTVNYFWFLYLKQSAKQLLVSDMSVFISCKQCDDNCRACECCFQDIFSYFK